MKYVALIALFGSVGVAWAEEDTKHSCDPVLTLEQLEPLTEEEKIILAELEEIENAPKIMKQAEAEAEIPLEAFGGC